MVDLQSQYQKIKSEIDESINQVLASSAYINGPIVKEFQSNLEKYLNVKHVIPCGNGTDALQIAMMGLELKPGDEVIVPSFTFIATAEVIALLGLKPIMVDVDYETFNISISDVRKKITPNTKAILPVHLFGQCADMEALVEIAKEHNLFIIEDNAQAIGSDFYTKDGGKIKAGCIGTVGCTSFFPSKNLGCYGDGGAIFTNDDNLANRIRSIANHGMTKRYYHDHIGVNSRLDSIQAAVLNVKLKYLDEYIKARQNAADFYDNAFKNHRNLTIPYRDNKSNHVFHQYTLKLKNADRTGLIDFLAEKKIPAMVYYPVPIHLQDAYKYLGYKIGDLPVTEQLMNEVFSLPMHTEFSEEQLEYITNSVLEFLG